MVGISSLSGVSGIQPTNQNSNARLQAAIARLVGLPGLFPTTDSVSGLSTVAKLQAQNAEIRQLSANIAQSTSLAQVADAGVQNVQAAVQQLQSLAQQASEASATAEVRAALNTQFQQAAQQINEAVRSANFNGQSLLDGSLSGSGSISLASAIIGDSENTGAGDLSIADLSSDALFAGNSLNILTAEGASQALETLGNALQSLGGVRNDISVFQQALDFAAATVDSVAANQAAASSSLNEGELGGNISANIQQNSGNAVTAQTSQLSPALLQLIS